MIPDHETLMRPVLECAAAGEARIGEVVEELAGKLGLTQDERDELLPSGKQTRFANRVHWAKSFLKQAGLVRPTKWAHFVITDRGKAALAHGAATIDVAYLEQFPEFQEFRARTNTKEIGAPAVLAQAVIESTATPDEVLRAAHKQINEALAADLLDRVRQAPPAFFENLIVELLLAMGYGGTSEDAGRALGKSGDDGIDGVIDQDALGLDQIYLQAKRYADGNNIGAPLQTKLPYR